MLIELSKYIIGVHGRLCNTLSPKLKKHSYFWENVVAFLNDLRVLKPTKNHGMTPLRVVAVVISYSSSMGSTLSAIFIISASDILLGVYSRT